MKRRYANAREALPPELVAEVQKHVSGLIWVPSPETFHRERRQLILALRDQGVPTKEIARLAGISVRRVNQVVAEKITIKPDSFGPFPVNNLYAPGD